MNNYYTKINCYIKKFYLQFIFNLKGFLWIQQILKIKQRRYPLYGDCID
jgi:hypothetical protein